MTTRILVVMHDADDHLNELAGPLVDAGFELDPWCTWTDRRPEAPPEHYDAMISMGATAGVEDHFAHAWMQHEVTYVEHMLAAGKPFLGVCFGSQLLAKVAGGRVFKARAPEIGWTTVVAEPEADADPLVAPLGEIYPGFHYHYDTFTPPDDAVVLARTGELVQAFRVGERAWGLQYHIEANPGVVYGWMGAFREEMEGAGVDFEQMRSETLQHWHRYRDNCWQLAAGFAEIVSGTGTDPA